MKTIEEKYRDRLWNNLEDQLGCNIIRFPDDTAQVIFTTSRGYKYVVNLYDVNDIYALRDDLLDPYITFDEADIWMWTKYRSDAPGSKDSGPCMEIRTKEAKELNRMFKKAYEIAMNIDPDELSEE